MDRIRPDVSSIGLMISLNHGSPQKGQVESVVEAVDVACRDC